MKRIIYHFYLIQIKFLSFFCALIHIIKPRYQPLFICLTIDCESEFENKIGIKKISYNRCFFQGSLKLNELLKQHGWHATFFIDYPEIEIFENEEKNVYQLIKILVKDSQDIQLHLHPSLINLDKISDLSYYSGQRIREMIREGKKILAKLSGKKITSFRAGGYSVGRAEKIIRVLEEEGFVVDSSVMPGSNNLHQAKFNFEKAPHFNWYHPDYRDFSKRGKAKIVELPITTVIKTSNNFASDFFRLDAKNVKIIKDFINYAYFNKRFKVITFIWHTKEIFDEDGEFTQNYENIKETLSFLKYLIDSGKRIKVGSVKNFINQHLLMTKPPRTMQKL